MRLSVRGGQGGIPLPAGGRDGAGRPGRLGRASGEPLRASGRAARKDRAGGRAGAAAHRGVALVAADGEAVLHALVLLELEAQARPARLGLQLRPDERHLVGREREVVGGEEEAARPLHAVQQGGARGGGVDGQEGVDAPCRSERDRVVATVAVALCSQLLDAEGRLEQCIANLINKWKGRNFPMRPQPQNDSRNAQDEAKKLVKATKEGRCRVQNGVQEVNRNGIPVEEIGDVDLKSFLCDAIGDKTSIRKLKAAIFPVSFSTRNRLYRIIRILTFHPNTSVRIKIA